MADETEEKASGEAGADARAESPAVRPFVAIGASAGGLAPTTELLRHLGEHPGFAIVVIHHLDPTHESGLVEILARATMMPVAAATDGARPEPDHVYVVPPNAGLLMEKGILKLVPRREEGGLHLPIDRFFESLAFDCTVLAIGVVLSGSGFDGSEGVKAIKAEGGMAFAQDGTAQHASMPDSAIATGCVDFILPPEGIARELVRIGSTPATFLAIPPQGTLEPEYQQILALVRRATAVDFTSYKHTTVRRRLQRRLFLHGLKDLSEYLALLQREPSELAAFAEEVLIHVTGFFREPEAFEALVATVFPKLCEDRPGNAPIRIWVPGCSTGEEVYSIAMCLIEYLEDTRRADLPIKIFGTDLSSTTVERARVGLYLESIERDVSPGRLQRFFTKESGGYQIRRDLRDLCVFARHDITRDPPFSAMDLISCRNLMIYLGPELQDRVIALLHYALKEPGFLLLGSAETVRAFAGFSTVDGRNKIYARTSAAPRLALDFTSHRLWNDTTTASIAAARAAANVPTGARSSSQPDVGREADRLVLAEYAPPGVVVTDDLAVLQFRGQTGPFLEPTPGVASLDLLRLAREELRLPLRRAIDHARSTQGRIREAAVSLLVGEARRAVSVEVIPFAVHATQQRFFLVLFEDVTPSEVAPPAGSAPAVDPERAEVEAKLKEELASTRQYLESVIEQLEATNEELKAANEEIVSSNEELRSTNEELQSAKEELQATNEELRTVNDEMKERNVEATRVNDDLLNVLSSVEIPIVMLGRDARIRRFTPAAAKVFGFTAGDLTRPVQEVVRIVAMVPTLLRMISEVLLHLQPAESAVQDDTGRWYHVTVRPYVTLDGRIDGTVITALDIDAVKRGAERLAEARRYAESVVDTVRESLVVLDRDFRIRSGNKAFQRSFRLTPRDYEGRRLDELGRAELALPALRELLAGLGEGDTVEDFRIEQKSDKGGAAHVFTLNARHIESTELILVALEDVTDIELAANAVQRVEMSFRELLTEASEAIVMSDEEGTLLFVNRIAAKTFGYAREELVGVSVEQLLPERLRELHVEHRAEYRAAPSTRIMGLNRELVGRRKDGTEFPVEVTLNSLSGDTGPVVVAFLSDITARREAERKIRDYQDRLKRMAFDAALTEERERRRIAVELHDRIGQSLALAQIKLTSARDGLSGATRTAVDEVVGLLEQSSAETRTLTFDLSPPVLYDLGLKAALSWLGDEVEKRYGIHVELVDDEADKPLDYATRALVFRAVRELLMNVFKHAKIQSARVTLSRLDDHFEIAVEDAGVGFDQEAASAHAGAGFGLLSVREQIQRLGGTLEVVSEPNHGTRVSMRLPLTVDGAPGTEERKA